MAESDTLAGRAQQVRRRVAKAALRSGRPSQAVNIVAVTKTVGVEMVQTTYNLGFTTFGENRVQEAQVKIAALPLPGIQWELIGHLQTNKAVRAAELFRRIQSVDSLRLAELLQRAAARRVQILPILLEVNVSGEISKSGLSPEELMNAATALANCPNLRPEGLMTIAPLVDDPEEVRPIFQQLRRYRDQLREHTGPDGCWNELSMGMSDDFEVAIEEGATIVRIGSALFGPRTQEPS